MALSLSEITIIHTRRLAKYGKKYWSEDGKLYVGTKEGRLKLLSIY